MQVPLRRESKRFLAPSLTIGFLVDGVEESYQWSLLRGVADTARNSGARVVCLVGGILEGPRAERNTVFALAGRGVVDGLVIASAAIGNRIGTAGLEEFCARFASLPICSIATPIAGTSSVCIDNAAGVRVAVQHLVNVHERRRIAFIRGPLANVEAEVRYDAYAEALRDEGLTALPELVVVGDFEGPSGAAAVRQLMAKQAPDAIVAANDMMAIGALDELARMGVRVPEQMVVFGFDDIEQARFTLPPLTTMRQPLYEQGCDAARTVIAQIRTGAPPENVTRHTEIVLRRSCGCLGGQVAPTTRVPDGRGRSFEAVFVERRQLLIAALTRAAHGELASHAGDDWRERLVNSVAEQMSNPEGHALVRNWDDLLRRLALSDAPLAICNDMLSALRDGALRCVDQVDRRTYVDDVFHELRMMTAYAMERAQARGRIQGDRRAREVGRAAAAITLARDANELSRALLDHMGPLDLRRCHVVEVSPAGNAHLVLSVAPNEAAPRTVNGTLRELLGHLMTDAGGERVFVTYSLTFDGLIGKILVLKIGETSGYVCEAIADVLGAWYRTHAT